MVLKQFFSGILIFVFMMALSFAMGAQDDIGLTIEDYLKRINAPDQKDHLVMVYFHADWCVPCLQEKPVVDNVTTGQKENCRIMKLDSDANPKVATQLEINTLPLFLFYKNGKQVHRHEGFLPEKELISRIATYK
ncbi:MAG: thioredoxin family protein [Bacteroidia bacterium]